MVEGFICEYNDKGGLLLQKGQRVEGLLIKNGKVQGGPGKIALLLPLSRDQNRGGEAGRRRRPSPAAKGTAAAAVRGKRGREARGIDPPLDFREGGL